MTKAIHIELVKSLTTQDFLKAFRRFVSRRGLPSLVLSDNGTNFVGANKELLKFVQHNKAEIEKFAADLNVTWKFIPPFSPHFGGLWEAGIKSAKTLLKRTIGSYILNYEELCTLLCQVESVLNSRPLCPMNDDPISQSFLTPGHFLVGRLLTNIPSPDTSNCPLSRLERWNLVQQLHRNFWHKWSKDYLQSLQQRRKWSTAGAWKPSVGDLVLLKEDNLPPLVWRTGVVHRLHPGCDNVMRVVTVKTKTGLFRRCIVKVCPFPPGEKQQ